MEVTVQSESLKRIARYLQERLKPQAQITPLQVQCAMKEGVMVLVQHPPGNAPDPQKIFSELEAAIATIPPDLIEPLLPTLNHSKIKLYLRVLGQQKPYAFHHVAFVPAPPVVSSSYTNPAAQAFDHSPTVSQPPPSNLPDSVGADADSQVPDRFLPDSSLIEDSEAEPDRGELVHTPLNSELAADQSPAQAPLARSQTAPKHRKLATRSWLKPLLIGTGGIAAAVLLGMGGYALTRPCVMGACQSLETAEALSQQAAQTLQTGNNEASDQQAKQQLEEARQLLEAIPAWSAHAGAAREVQQQLDQVLEAEATAESATQKSQAPSQSVTDWQAVESSWKQAIAQLEAISADSPLYAFAQKRLTTYRANLLFIDQRIALEKNTRERLTTARKTAELAIARQNTAQQLADWQQARATWQVAINTLKQIPEGTSSHSEAQQLLSSYQPKLTETNNRVTQELLANKTYNQALTFEKQAKALQQKNQWSQAIASWQKALNAAKQVPDGTSISSQAQNLIPTYTSAVKQAETIVQVRGDLNKVCFSSGKVCTYTITNNVIEVRFMPAYERKVRTLGGMSYFSGDYETMQKIDTHFATLARALQTISNNAGVPIQVFNSDNELVGSFIPGNG